MNLPTEIFGDVIVVHTPEELGADQCDALTAYLPTLERRAVVIDSKGLAALMDVQDKVRDMGGEAKIATGNSTNRKILELTRLDQQLEVFDSVVDAVKSFQ